MNDHPDLRHWFHVKDRALARARNRCEGRVPQPNVNGVLWCHKGELVTEPCRRTTGLQVHHLHYDSFGREDPDDVRVLCDRCHRAATVLRMQCRACGSLLSGTEEDAWNFILDPFSGALVGPVTEVARNWFGWSCPACTEMSDPDRQD